MAVSKAMPINTDFLVRCINTLESASKHLHERGPDDPLYDIFRAAAVKEFEIILEQSGSLLKKRLRPYLATNRQADRLTFKDLPARRQAWPHCLGGRRALGGLPGQPQRHGPQLWAEIRGGDAQASARLHPRCPSAGNGAGGGRR